MIEGCILVIFTEFRTGGDAFLVIQCFWGKKTNYYWDDDDNEFC